MGNQRGRAGKSFCGAISVLGQCALLILLKKQNKIKEKKLHKKQKRKKKDKNVMLIPRGTVHLPRLTSIC